MIGSVANGAKISRNVSNPGDSIHPARAIRWRTLAGNPFIAFVLDIAIAGERRLVEPWSRRSAVLVPRRTGCDRQTAHVASDDPATFPARQRVEEAMRDRLTATNARP